MVEMIGKKFGELTVTERSLNKGNHVAWNCKCSCGKSTTVRGTALRAGAAKSCGCSRRAKRSSNMYPDMDTKDKKSYLNFLSWNRVTYDLTEEGYRYMLDVQRGCCDSCRDSLEMPCVDHDHYTGEVRGLLCQGCNKAAGLLKDSSEVGMRLVTYLMKHGK